MEPAAVLIAVRFALYLVLMLVFGLPLFSLYTMRGVQVHADRSILPPIAVTALVLAGVALSVLGLALLAAAMSGLPVSALDRATLRALLDETAIGTAGEVRVVALIALLPIGWWSMSVPRRRWALQSSLGAVALGSLVWTGHGAADDGRRGIVHLTADLIHLFAAAVWIGALAGLMILLLRTRGGGDDRSPRIALAQRALAGFSGVGTLCVGLIIVTGLVNSWLLVGVANIPFLAGSLYGRLLILKLLLFAAMLGLAGLNRFRLTPALEAALGNDAAAPAARATARSVALELGLAVIVLALVAWLGTLAPPATAG